MSLITGVFCLIMYQFHPLFLVFTPFFLLFYLSIGWGFTKSYREKQFNNISIRTIIPGLILFSPAYYLIVSIQKLKEK